MKLIVGLGNPGETYKITRHNIGFMVIDHYINDNDWKTKWNSLYYEKTINNEKVIFIKPLTYMNLSGNAVAEYVNFYKLNLSDILIIQDDLDLKIGTYRLKNNSSDGGHNGIKSIIDKLGTKNFILAHLSHQNNTTELAKSTTIKTLNTIGADTENDLTIAVATQDNVLTKNTF